MNFAASMDPNSNNVYKKRPKKDCEPPALPDRTLRTTALRSLTICCSIAAVLISCTVSTITDQSRQLIEFEFVSGGDGPYIVLLRFFASGAVELEPVRTPGSKKIRHHAQLAPKDRDRLTGLLASNSLERAIQIELAQGNNIGGHDQFVGIKTKRYHFQRLNWTLQPETLKLLELAEDLALAYLPGPSSEYLSEFVDSP